MREITDAQAAELRTYYKLTVEHCTKCGGSAAEECECSVVYAWIRELVKASIPPHYWNIRKLTLPKAVAGELEKYLAALNNATANSIGMLFCGDSGVGKTTAMCHIGKTALKAGKTTTYLLAAELNKLANRIKCGDSDASALDELLFADILLLDEFDKLTITDSARQNILNAVKERLGKVWIIATNYDEKEIEDTFGSAMMSLLRRHTIIIPFVGKDLSEKVQSGLRDKLAASQGTVIKGLLPDALEWQQGVQARLKQSYDEVL
jgi:DNA replication protein DnaC